MNFKLILALFLSIISLNTRSAYFNPAPLTPGAIAGALINHVAGTVLQGVNQTAVPVAQSIVHNRCYVIGSKIAFWSTITFFGYWLIRYMNENRNTEQKSSVQYKDNKLILETDMPVCIYGHHGKFKIETIYSDENQDARSRRNLMSFVVSVWRWLCQPPYNPITITRAWVPYNTNVIVHTSNPYSYRTPAIETRNINGTQKITADHGDITIIEPEGPVDVETIHDINIENFSNSVNASNFSHFVATRREGCRAPVVVLGSSRQEPFQKIYVIEN